jgi:hypothetical protein
MKGEKAIQTVESHDALEAGKQDEKKTKEIENLLRTNTELKQTLEVQRGKVRASKETIKRLLVEQSRMERKQVNLQSHADRGKYKKYIGQGTRDGGHPSNWPVPTDSPWRTLQGPVDRWMGHGGN